MVVFGGWLLAAGFGRRTFGAGGISRQAYGGRFFGDGFGGGRRTFGGERRGFNSVLLTAAFRR